MSADPAATVFPTDPATLLLVAAVFLLAGLVKGLIGLGLPTVSLALLTAAVGLQPAMALMLAPAFLTNLWQGLGGGRLRPLLARLWPFLLTAGLTIWLGAAALTRIELRWLSALLGLLLVLYALYGLARPPLLLSRRGEPWIGLLAGLANGLLTGMTGSFVVPGVAYLQALGLPRDALVQAMGLLFGVSTVALAVALGGRGLLSPQLGCLSLAAIAPALSGLWLGRRLRGRLDEVAFRRVLLAALLLLGLWIVWRELARQP
ncbi:hypothetical protein SAMN06265365_12350 [Tistlia consotensis]|uniref:Probable membrane transporter protein n=1 Tax=Tistlia consotensis USBA 355 TaxID=560819 RepID=A0A1Y6CGV4_9PROT|nr:sulfite exporter TauE/SafE family protein [Tistlia consotensis]SMF64562.1 hypothetical protein SAMN05428998_12559 [Tistlia consotensis USBA 355]SNR97371.1 hypothetical protein SAMN06265365_12350 [Tistlia consotensis]